MFRDGMVNSEESRIDALSRTLCMTVRRPLSAIVPSLSNLDPDLTLKQIKPVRSWARVEAGSLGSRAKEAKRGLEKISLRGTGCRNL